MWLIRYVNVITDVPVIRNRIDETAIGYKVIFKTQKISPQYKKILGVIFWIPKSAFARGLGSSKIDGGFLPSKISHFLTPKKAP